VSNATRQNFSSKVSHHAPPPLAVDEITRWWQVSGHCWMAPRCKYFCLNKSHKGPQHHTYKHDLVFEIGEGLSNSRYQTIRDRCHAPMFWAKGQICKLCQEAKSMVIAAAHALQRSLFLLVLFWYIPFHSSSAYFTGTFREPQGEKRQGHISIQRLGVVNPIYVKWSSPGFRALGRPKRQIALIPS
jgi:hypothetical protein